MPFLLLIHFISASLTVQTFVKSESVDSLSHVVLVLFAGLIF